MNPSIDPTLEIVRCGQCDHVLLEIEVGKCYAIRCKRCGWWNSRRGSFLSREAVAAAEPKKSA